MKQKENYKKNKENNLLDKKNKITKRECKKDKYNTNNNIPKDTKVNFQTKIRNTLHKTLITTTNNKTNLSMNLKELKKEKNNIPKISMKEKSKHLLKSNMKPKKKKIKEFKMKEFSTKEEKPNTSMKDTSVIVDFKEVTINNQTIMIKRTITTKKEINNNILTLFLLIQKKLNKS